MKHGVEMGPVVMKNITVFGKIGSGMKEFIKGDTQIQAETRVHKSHKVISCKVK
jgi:hypothetical protein